MLSSWRPAEKPSTGFFWSSEMNDEEGAIRILRNYEETCKRMRARNRGALTLELLSQEKASALSIRHVVVSSCWKKMRLS
jgi:hypothetical protein